MFREVNKWTVLVLWAFHVSFITLSNYLVQFTHPFWGYDFTWAMLTFPFVVLATDLTIRLAGQTTARVVIALAFIPAVFSSAYFSEWRVALASGGAYLFGQLLDVFVFQRIRERSQKWWAAPAVSSVMANVVDTYLFYGAAFHNNPNQQYMSDNWRQISTNDLTLKVLFSFVIILPIYGVVLDYASRRMSGALQKG